MSKRVLEARMLQLLALDKNAYDIYSDLTEKVDMPTMKETFGKIAKDELKHVKLWQKLLLLLK